MDKKEVKKEEKNSGILKFFETLILIILIISVVMIVFETFNDQIFGDDEYYDDYEYQDYSYDSYDSYDYYDSEGIYDSYYNDDYNNLENTNSNETSNFNFTSIEDFMNSEEGKSFLREPEQNILNAADTIVEEEPEDSQKALKEEFEEQKKNIEVKYEGKSASQEIMLSIKNNNEDFVHDLILNTIFFKDGEIVFVDIQNINVIDGNKVRYAKANYVPDDYDDFKFLITKMAYTDYYGELLNDKVKYSAEERKGKVEISVQNKSNKKLNRINFTVLYFDDSGNILDFETVQEYNLKSKDTNEISAYGIWDGEKGKYLDFYKYEIILDYAEKY